MLVMVLVVRRFFFVYFLRALWKPSTTIWEYKIKRSEYTRLYKHRTWGYKWLVIDMIDILFVDVLHNISSFAIWHEKSPSSYRQNVICLDHPQKVATMKIGYDMTMKMVTFLATNESKLWLRALVSCASPKKNMKSLSIGMFGVNS